MTPSPGADDARDTRWALAATTAALLAVDPVGLGGVIVHGRADATRDHWLASFRALLPPGTPVRRVPLHITDGRLLGGLDLGATLQSGKPVVEAGVIAATHGGVLLLAMAERMGAATAARIAAILDTRMLMLEREGFTLRTPVHVALVAFDEGTGPDEMPPAVLGERLAFRLDLSGLRPTDTREQWHTADDIRAARVQLPRVQASDDIVEALCAASLALGVDSLRAATLTLNVAKVSAALAGRDEVSTEDATLAAQLVLSPRATRVPAPPPDDTADNATEPPGETPPEPPSAADTADDQQAAPDADSPPPEDEPEASAEPQELTESVVAASQSAIPAGLLAQLAANLGGTARARSSGRAGAYQNTGLRGRPAGIARGEPRRGARLNILETLRAAAPWQGIRRKALAHAASAMGGKGAPLHTASPRLRVLPEDFRVARYRERRETTTIFVVDASGSAAMARLAEAKGAVELLLADCYVRRDRVAVVSFRGRSADVLLPPTRSLVRAKRGLAALAGGGGTPLAAAIDAASALADAVTRRGGSPTVVFLTDGRANIARDGAQGRQRADSDARDACRAMVNAHATVMLIDTSPRGEPLAQALAVAMRARYMALPYANASTLSQAVRSAAPVRAAARLA